MVDPEKRPLLTERQRGRLLAFFVVYTILFVVVGPKFASFAVYDEIKDGVFVSNRIHRFVGGSHQGDTVKLCFEGRLNGKKSWMLYTMNLVNLKESIQNFGVRYGIRFNESSYELLDEVFDDDCNSLTVPNVIPAKFANSYTFTSRMLFENEAYITGLPKGSFLFLYSYDEHEADFVNNRFGVYVNEQHQTFLNFRIRGGIQKESDLGAWDFMKAVLKDYLLWPYIIFLLFSGAASH